MITKTHIFCQKVQEKNGVKDTPKKLVKCTNCHILRDQVKFFKLNFLSSPLPKLINLGAYQIEFPEFFKTPLTFYPRVILLGVIANKNMKLWATSFAVVGCTSTKRQILMLSCCRLSRHDSLVFIVVRTFARRGNHRWRAFENRCLDEYFHLNICRLS